jgi:hypothetical protein
MIRFTRRAIRLLAVVAVLNAPMAHGQQSAARGSRFIGTSDWMTEVATRLRARGHLKSLNPLVLPWTRDEVAREVAAIPAEETDTMPRHVAQWFALLRSELRPEISRIFKHDSVAVGFKTWFNTVAATSPRIDPYFPIRSGVVPINGKRRDDQKVWPAYGVGGWAERGPFAADLQIGYDFPLRRADPDGQFPRRIFDAMPDNEVSYLSAHINNAAIVVGRLRRNWAPLGAKGLMVSDNAVGIPQLGFELGGRNLVVNSFIGELDTLLGKERYIAAHRIQYSTENFAIAVGEAKVYLSKGGPRLVNLNPVEIFFITGDKLGGEEFTNTALNGQFWLRRGRLSLGGETHVDDMFAFANRKAPPRIGMSMSADYVTPVHWLELGADYRMVASFTYWTPEGHQNVDQWSYYGRGIGDNQSDYDRVTFRANVYPAIAGLRLTPTVALQRKGEWDFRVGTLPDSIWHNRPMLIQGVGENMTRLALAGRWQRSRSLFAEWDAGINLVKDASHVAGDDRTEFSAMFRVGVMWSAPR